MLALSGCAEHLDILARMIISQKDFSQTTHLGKRPPLKFFTQCPWIVSNPQVLKAITKHAAIMVTCSHTPLHRTYWLLGVRVQRVIHDTNKPVNTRFTKFITWPAHVFNYIKDLPNSLFPMNAYYSRWQHCNCLWTSMCWQMGFVKSAKLSSCKRNRAKVMSLKQSTCFLQATITEFSSKTYQRDKRENWAVLLDYPFTISKMTFLPWQGDWQIRKYGKMKYKWQNHQEVSVPACHVVMDFDEACLSTVNFLLVKINLIVF